MRKAKCELPDNGYNFRPEVHDHFDGSAHCIQCGGPCRQDPQSMFITVLVRWLLEAEALHRASTPYLATRFLAEAGVDVATLRRRARETGPSLTKETKAS